MQQFSLLLVYICIYYLCIRCMVKYKMLLGNIHTKLMIVIVTDGGYFQKGMGIWLNENAFCHAAEPLGNISF